MAQDRGGNFYGSTSSNIGRNTTDAYDATDLISKTSGIEGLPYQFPASVDRRINNTGAGRKYSEKIMSRLPLLFLIPCEPKFMEGSSNENKSIIASLLAGDATSTVTNLLTGNNRYYTTVFNYATYWQYANTMLACVSAYLGIYNRQIKIGNQSLQKIGKINWQYENTEYRRFIDTKAEVIYYLDSFDSVSESFSNDTTESSIASQVNQAADNLNELRFLFGGAEADNMIADAMQGTGDLASAITSAFSGGIEKIGGGIVGSLAEKGVDSIVNGGKVIFPEIWSNSDYSKSYNLEIKLRSPDNDNLSIFLNILKPYCKLLAMTIPRQVIPKNLKDQFDPKAIDPNAYSAPFLVKAYSKGMFSIDMGIISSLSVTKGATGQWNDDGLPTQLDISIEIKDLYPKFAMSYTNSFQTNLVGCISNTAYMDFLANMAGLNVGESQVGRRATLYKYLTGTFVSRLKGDLGTAFTQSVENLIGKFYNIF